MEVLLSAAHLCLMGLYSSTGERAGEQLPDWARFGCWAQLEGKNETIDEGHRGMFGSTAMLAMLFTQPV